MSILLFCERSSTRLQYICKFIFGEQLSNNCSITIDAENFEKHDGPKINYSTRSFADNSLQIIPQGLLLETGIRAQQIDCEEGTGNKYFFKTGGHYPYDILSGCFYLISRYEEYLPYTEDDYGRYAHTNSIAFKKDFLKIPLVNFWIQDFVKILQYHYPVLKFTTPAFAFHPTYDIDIAYAYLYKGLIRNLGGFLLSPSLGRLKVLSGFKGDPYDVYDYLDDLHEKHGLKPRYFYLVAESNGLYDKNIPPANPAMQHLLKKQSEKYEIGLHPSWASYHNEEIVQAEKEVLSKLINKRVVFSRQHYIRFSLPKSFEILESAGITDDYSMGYGSINGFRASVASPYPWYNLEKEKISKLRIHPFCFMDANSFFEQHYTAGEALQELIYYKDQCKKANARLTTIFHNNILGYDSRFDGWRTMYSRFISQLL